MAGVSIKKISGYLEKDGLNIIDTNVYIVSYGKSAAIIDIGGGYEKVINYLKEKDLDVKYIFLTHSHFDHIYYLDDLKQMYPEAKVVASIKSKIKDEDVTLIKDINGESIKTDIDIFVKDKDKIFLGSNKIYENIDIKEKIENGIVNLSKDSGIEFNILDTPGHTIDSICILMVYKEKEILFSGDTIFKDSIGRTDFKTGSIELMEDTLKRLKRIIKDNVLVLPGHGENTSFKDWKKVFYRL